MTIINYIEVPTYDASTNTYYKTPFKTKEDFINYLEPLLKYPGEYEFDQDYLHVITEGMKFRNQGYYCDKPFKSKDFITYWEGEKDKCRNGLLILSSSGKKWYVPRDYYMWLNFLPIYHKEKRINLFPDLYDGQYHIALYEFIGDLKGLHIVFLKKRQYAMSFYHMAKLINQVYFEKGVTLKLLAYEDSYINMEGSWDFLVQYRDFLNEHTAWYRPFQPDEVGNWNQRIKVSENGRDNFRGNKGRIIGKSTKQSPTKGVGGACLLKDSLIYNSQSQLVKIQDVKEGDYILGADGKPKKVNKCFTGYNDIYQVDQSNGKTYYVTENHLLYLFDSGKNKYFTIETKDFNTLPKWSKSHTISGTKINGLEYEEKKLFIEPYWFGAWLGDGEVSKPTILVNTDKDPEIFNYLEDYADKLGLRLHLNRRKNTRPEYKDEMFDVSISGHYPFSLGGDLNHITNKQKLIPDAYLYNSRSNRLELLAGILDTDGHYNKIKNRFEISIKNLRLLNEIITLCTNLGFVTKTHFKKNKGKTSTVYNHPTTIGYLHISGDIVSIPTKIVRKQAIKNSPRSIHKRSKITVTYWGVGEYYGFDCEDHLFVLDDLTITHNSRYIIVEEAGVNPSLDKTYGYAKAALQAGPLLTTGQFIAYGSVGDLKQCEPLKEFMKKPVENGFYGIPCRDYDSSGSEKVAGLFAPEFWNLQGYTDEYGNSDIQGAKTALLDLRIQQKKDLNPEAYQLEISQHPLTIEEAFDSREESPFPSHLIAKQLDRILNNEYAQEYIDLFRNAEGKVESKKTNKIPISEFPLSKKATSYEKEGVIVIYERPDAKSEWGTYFASIDPLSEGKSNTSNSLCSIVIYKNSIRVTKEKDDGSFEHFTEGDKIVAEWCGRFDDINKTHERLELMIEWYNAWTLVEANVGLFFTYMTLKNKTHYLVPSNQMIFNRELSNNYSPSHPYGWKNVGSIFKTHLLSAAIEFLSEELSYDVLPSGDKVNIRYGVERIPSKMLLQEMKAYHTGLNVDRLVSFAALVSFVRIQQASRKSINRVIKNNDSAQNKNLYKKPTSAFRNVGKSMISGNRKSGFKNLK